MNKLIRLNSKNLITKELNKNAMILKLKKGDKVKAKVMEFNKDTALLNIKGTDILTKVSKALIKGQVLNLEIQGFEEDKLLVKIEEEMGENQKGLSKKGDNLKKAVISESIKGKMLIKKEKIEELMIQYKKIIGNKKKLNKNVIKTLLIIEDNDLEFSEELFKNIKAYIDKEVKKKIKIDDELKDNIKKALKELKDSDEPFDKGTKLLNALNKKDKKNVLEFMFLINENLNPVEIKIKYEKKEKNGEIDKENNYMNIDLELENFGEIGIRVNSCQKRVEILFLVNETVKKEEILKEINLLEERIEKIGYSLGNIKVKELEKKEELTIKGVNIKV
ncbi:MAG: hypothetical protein B6I28_04985 [Fusobacteriia bacterium 4572_132]|nr:MAG: hypothetical protein B6I28_04985 [Fusobacteriia bacterium 4572_132]